MEGFLLVCVFVLLVIIFHNRSKQKNERTEDRKLIRDLTTRVYFLEESVNKLKREPAATTDRVAEAAPAAKTAPPPKPAEPIHPVKAVGEAPATPEVVTVTVKAPSLHVPLKTPLAPPTPPIKPIEPPVVTTRPAAPVTPPVAPVHRAVTAVAPPRFETVQRKPSKPLKEQIQSVFNWVEAKLGEQWLGKIGISLVVLGIAGYLAAKVSNSPAGKVCLVLTGTLAVLGTGIWLESKSRYRILARCLIAGGWATLFFLSWAIYNLDATKLITSVTLDYVLMLGVAITMVWHTLRFRSQLVTGLAYVLAFLTIGLNHGQVAFVNGLGAGLLLAGGLTFIVVRYQWYELEVFGILASYVNYFLWVNPYVEEHLPYPAMLGAAGLVLYWLVFRVSYVWRKTANQAQERISTFSALLNPALLLTLLKYQSVHKEWAFWGLLAIGAVETALGQLPVTRRRRTAVIVLSTLGVVLLVSAFPVKFSGMELSVYWLLDAEALVLIGIWTQEIVFRRLGLLTALVVSGHMIAVDAYRVYVERVATDHPAPANFSVALFFVIAAIVFYADAHWMSRRWAELFEPTFDRRLLQRLSYVAGLMAFIAAWLAFPESWTAVAWCALAAGLTWAGRRFAIGELFYQANVLSAAGVVRALLINVNDAHSYGHFSLRLITVSLISALLYLTAHWSFDSGASHPSTWRRFTNAGYTWMASILLGLLVWYELHDQHAVSIAVIWAIGGLLLALLGRWLSKRDLTYQANAATLAAVVRLWLVNYQAEETYYFGLTLRLISVTAVAVVLYVGSHWSWVKQANAVRKPRLAPALYTWAGTFLLAALAWYEVRVAAVAVIWAFGGLVLALLGRRLENRDLTYQANLLALAAFVETAVFNYSATNLVFHRFTERLVSVSLTAVLLYVTSRWSWVEESGEREFFVGSSEFPFSHVVRGIYIWAGSTLLAVLAWYELLPISVAVAWMIGGLVLLELGLWRKSASLRAQAYLALACSFGRIFVVNLNASAEGISPRMYTVAPIALALFYAYARLLESQPQLRPVEQKVHIAGLFCWLGTTSVAALLRFELQPDWVAAGWAALAFSLVAVAWVTQRVFLHQSLLLSLAIAFRAVFHNFYQRSNFPPPLDAPWYQSRWALVGTVVAFLFLALPFLFRLRKRDAGEAQKGWLRRFFGALDRHPEQLFFFIATGLLSTMLALEMNYGVVTLAWAIEGFAIFVMALVAGERSFRLTGLGLLLLCFAKIMIRDVWQLQVSDRYLTFIVLGVALVLVHFLYNRYREKILQYL